MVNRWHKQRFNHIKHLAAGVEWAITTFAVLKIPESWPLLVGFNSFHCFLSETERLFNSGNSGRFYMSSWGLGLEVTQNFVEYSCHSFFSFLLFLKSFSSQPADFAIWLVSLTSLIQISYVWMCMDIRAMQVHVVSHTESSSCVHSM